jgi:protoporphyrinogen IX oxidase
MHASTTYFTRGFLMLWIKAFHIIFIVTWFAGLFYLPRLFVYHSEATDIISLERFKVMERKLYYYIMTPSMLLAVFFGLCLLMPYWSSVYKTEGWMHTKLLLVFILLGYHHSCGVYLKRFANNDNRRSSKFYRIFNEVPVVLLIAIVILAVVKPF